MFIRVHETKLVVGIEVVIDPHVELVAVIVFDVTSGAVVLAVDAARKPNARRIQTVADRVIVRQRHSRKQGVLDKTRRIVSRTE